MMTGFCFLFSGRGIALILHSEGAKVAISSRTKAELEETISLANAGTDNNDTQSSCPSPSMMSRTMSMHVADVTKKDDVENMVQDIVREWGGLDILINNAGGSQSPKGPVDGLDDSEAFTRLLQLNVVAPHLVTNAVCRLAMKENGRILNISSKAGKVGLQNYSFYVASKHALEGMTSSWSKELKDRNIIVNSMSPGMVDTKSFPKPPGKKGVRTPESIRDCLLFSLTSGIEFTGHYIHVDEFDMVVGKHGLSAATQAWKPIDEAPFSIGN